MCALSVCKEVKTQLTYIFWQKWIYNFSFAFEHKMKVPVKENICFIYFKYNSSMNVHVSNDWLYIFRICWYILGRFVKV